MGPDYRDEPDAVPIQLRGDNPIYRSLVVGPVGLPEDLDKPAATNWSLDAVMVEGGRTRPVAA